MAQAQYTDLSTLKSYLKLSDSDNSQDVYLTTLISGVQRFVDTFTQRSFGWGDPGDSPDTDYSNSDNIAVINFSVSGSLLTVTTMGAIPFVLNQNISCFGFNNPSFNGVFKIVNVLTPTQVTVDTSVSKGTLSPTNTQALPAGGSTYLGYIGNYVQNYKYVKQKQFDGLVGKTIFTPNTDLRSVDTLYIGLRNIAQPVLLDHTQYVPRDDGRIILGGAYFNSYDSAAYSGDNDNSFYGSIAAGYQTILVSYYYGYIGVPADIQLATLDICAIMYNLRRAGGLHMEKAGDYQIQFDLTLRRQLQDHPDSLNLLNIWKRYRISS
jgi:hypothetical protein